MINWARLIYYSVVTKILALSCREPRQKGCKLGRARPNKRSKILPIPCYFSGRARDDLLYHSCLILNSSLSYILFPQEHYKSALIQTITAFTASLATNKADQRVHITYIQQKGWSLINSYCSVLFCSTTIDAVLLQEPEILHL